MASRAEYESYLNLPQVRATLDTIAWAEDADYNVMFGGGIFSGDQHPNDCIPFRDTCSTAAGRYQFLYRTWRGLGLPDFSPRNQDIGALMLIQQRGALDEILAGNFEAAMRSGALGREWASFPFSPYGQTIRTPEAVMNYYNAALAAYGGQVQGNYTPPTSGTGSETMLLYGLGFVLLFLVIDN